MPKVPQDVADTHLINRNSTQMYIVRNTADMNLLRKLEVYLRPAEKQRAHNFRDLTCYTQFVTTRAYLRLLLGQILEISPQEISIQTSSNGRPLVEGMPGIDFNVSHSHKYSAIGLVRPGHIGVDIEEINLVPEYETIAKLAFTADEQELILETPHDQRGLAFIRIWTKREAASKALGLGISALKKLPSTLNSGEYACGVGTTVLRLCIDEFLVDHTHIVSVAHPAANKLELCYSQICVEYT